MKQLIQCVNSKLLGSSSTIDTAIESTQSGCSMITPDHTAVLQYLPNVSKKIGFNPLILSI